MGRILLIRINMHPGIPGELLTKFLVMEHMKHMKNGRKISRENPMLSLNVRWP